MPYRLWSSNDGRIMRVSANGPLGFEDSDRVFADIEQALAVHPEAGMLIDVQGIQYTPTTSDVRHFVSRHTEITRIGRNPFALVTDPGVNFGMAMMMCTLIEVTGGSAHAFTDPEQAESWLIEELKLRSSSPSA